MTARGESYDERQVAYPRCWLDEYKRTGYVAVWREHFPHLFLAKPTAAPSAALGTLRRFPQSALQYHLAEHGIDSLTSHRMANALRTSGKAVEMNRRMGRIDFINLQQGILSAGLSIVAGEPDLFCWHGSSEWFFAEAKHLNQSTSRQQAVWLEVYRRTIGPLPKIRLYRLRPSDQPALHSLTY
jgi:hypothetical protein